MKLVPPSRQYKENYAAAVEELQDEPHTLEEKRPTDINEYIVWRTDHAQGKNLPEGWIPASTFWLVESGIVVGEVSIRHELTEFLRTVGGHIGYWIRPSKRRQGYGKEILRLALQQAKNLGIAQVLITCDETNDASRKIIEANGGIFEKMTEMENGQPCKLLFWIQT